MVYVRGKVVHMEVVKRKGKEHEKLLIPDDEDLQDKKKVSACLKINFENLLLE